MSKLRFKNSKSLGGGASAAQQYLKAGLVDEMEISLVPTLLGGGERLFNDVGNICTGSSSYARWPRPR